MANYDEIEMQKYGYEHGVTPDFGIYKPVWVMVELGLSGLESDIYSYFYSATQANKDSDSKVWAKGSIQFLAKFFNASKQGVINVINSLIDKKLLVKTQYRGADDSIMSNLYCAIVPEYIFATGFEAKDETNAILPSKYADAIEVDNSNPTNDNEETPVKPLVNKVDKGSQQSLQGVVNKVDKGSQQSLQGVVNKVDNHKINIKNNNKIKNKNSLVNFSSEDLNSSNSKIQKTKNKSTFEIPTLEEVESYCQEEKLCIDPETFWCYYEQNGWKVGKNKMQNWQAACKYWDRRERNRKSFTNSKFNNDTTVEDKKWLKELIDQTPKKAVRGFTKKLEKVN